MESKSGKKVKAGSFQGMGLHDTVLRGLGHMGYKAPTPVQRKALPAVLSGLDIVCMARTGSGKTCVFLLPMVQRLLEHQSTGVRAIILSPTRELAVQTYKFAKEMAKYTDLRLVSILGGDGMDAQFDALSSKPDAIIATPGRLMHHLREIKNFKLKTVRYLVFDEADRLFEMGFAEQLNEIVRECPKDRQTLLFSATMPKILVQFSRAGLKDPQLIRLDTDVKMSDELRMSFFLMRSNEKLAALLYFCRTLIPSEQQTIIFVATRHHVELLQLLFNKLMIPCTAVYGSMDQDARSDHLKQFRQGEVKFLIVTDLAARGIDVPLLNNVINFHFPPSPKLFVHRCGRAARQGRIGFAFSLVEPEEMAFMMDVHRFLDKPVSVGDPKVIDSDQVDQSNPNNTLQTYTLAQMEPTMIHSGLIPQDILDAENDFLKRLLTSDDDLQALYKISENAMQQYRRTRPEATHEGVKAAKKAVRTDFLSKTIHPLILGSDTKYMANGTLEKMEYVRMLQTFRPQQTVFESGIGTGMTAKHAHSSTANTNGAKEKSNEAAERVREFRAKAAWHLKTHKARVEGATEMNVTTAAEHEDENEANNDGHDDEGNEADFDGEEDDAEEGDDNDEYLHGNEDDDINQDDISTEPEDNNYNNHQQENDHDNQSFIDMDMASYASFVAQNKKRLSAAERRKMKKLGVRISYSADLANDDNDEPGSKRQKKVDTFIDPQFYMSYGTENVTRTFAEEAMQPLSNLRSSDTFSSTDNRRSLDHAVLDFTAEDLDNEDGNGNMKKKQQKKLMRWDPKKRKFVQQTLDEMAEARKKGLKHLRSESGASMSQLSNKAPGEMYNEWKKKRKRSIGDDFDGSNDDGSDEDYRKRPNVRVNMKAKDEIRRPEQIRKLVAARENNKMKNMEKGKRRKIEDSMRRGGGRGSSSGGRGSSSGGRSSNGRGSSPSGNKGRPSSSSSMVGRPGGSSRGGAGRGRNNSGRGGRGGGRR